MKPFAHLSIIYFAIGISFCHPVNAQNRVIRGYNLQTENDVFAGFFGLKNEDKDYSGGFKFEFYTDYLHKGIFPFFKCRDCVDTDKPECKNFNSVYLHGMGFTPDRDSFVVTSVVRSQRPFSSILALGFKRVAVFPESNSSVFIGSIVSDLFLGKIGGTFPGDVQNFLHQYITNSKMVKGWQNQIANGGRFAFNYYLNANIGFDFEGGQYVPKLYLTPHASYGNIFQNGGMKVAITDQDPAQMGLITPMRSNTLNALINQSPYPGFGRFGDHFDYELYYRATCVYHNTLLMGLPMYDNSIYTVPNEKINRVVHDFGGRFLFRYYPDKQSCDKKTRLCTVYFELIRRSKEFSYGDNHIFGNIGVTVFNLD